MQMPKKTPKEFPTLLNKSDAMMFAAHNLTEMASSLRMFKLIADTVPEDVANKMTGDGKDAFDEIKAITRSIVDVDIQANAMCAAAAEIRSMAHETKLAEARAAAHGISART